MNSKIKTSLKNIGFTLGETVEASLSFKGVIAYNNNYREKTRGIVIGINADLTKALIKFPKTTNPCGLIAGEVALGYEPSSKEEVISFGKFAIKRISEEDLEMEAKVASDLRSKMALEEIGFSLGDTVEVSVNSNGRVDGSGLSSDKKRIRGIVVGEFYSSLLIKFPDQGHSKDYMRSIGAGIADGYELKSTEGIYGLIKGIVMKIPKEVLEMEAKKEADKAADDLISKQMEEDLKKIGYVLGQQVVAQSFGIDGVKYPGVVVGVRKTISCWPVVRVTSENHPKINAIEAYSDDIAPQYKSNKSQGTYAWGPSKVSALVSEEEPKVVEPKIESSVKSIDENHTPTIQKIDWPKVFNWSIALEEMESKEIEVANELLKKDAEINEYLKKIGLELGQKVELTIKSIPNFLKKGTIVGINGPYPVIKIDELLSASEEYFLMRYDQPSRGISSIAGKSRCWAWGKDNMITRDGRDLIITQSLANLGYKVGDKVKLVHPTCEGIIVGITDSLSVIVSINDACPVSDGYFGVPVLKDGHIHSSLLEKNDGSSKNYEWALSSISLLKTDIKSDEDLIAKKDLFIKESLSKLDLKIGDLVEIATTRYGTTVDPGGNLKYSPCITGVVVGYRNTYNSPILSFYGKGWSPSASSTEDLIDSSALKNPDMIRDGCFYPVTKSSYRKHDPSIPPLKSINFGVSLGDEIEFLGEKLIVVGYDANFNPKVKNLAGVVNFILEDCIERINGKATNFRRSKSNVDFTAMSAVLKKGDRLLFEGNLYSDYLIFDHFNDNGAACSENNRILTWHFNHILSINGNFTASGKAFCIKEFAKLNLSVGDALEIFGHYYLISGFDKDGIPLFQEAVFGHFLPGRNPKIIRKNKLFETIKVGDLIEIRVAGSHHKDEYVVKDVAPNRLILSESAKDYSINSDTAIVSINGIKTEYGLKLEAETKPAETKPAETKPAEDNTLGLRIGDRLSFCGKSYTGNVTGYTQSGYPSIEYSDEGSDVLSSSYDIYSINSVLTKAGKEYDEKKSKSAVDNTFGLKIGNIHSHSIKELDEACKLMRTFIAPPVKQDSKLKKELTAASYRVAATQATNLSKNAILALLKNQGATNNYINSISTILDTEFGKSLISVAIGAGVSHLVSEENDTKLSKFAKECRINGMTILGNAIIDSVIESAVKVIKDESNEMIELKESEYSLSDYDSNNEHELIRYQKLN